MGVAWVLLATGHRAAWGPCTARACSQQRGQQQGWVLVRAATSPMALLGYCIPASRPAVAAAAPAVTPACIHIAMPLLVLAVLRVWAPAAWQPWLQLAVVQEA